ncbi:hypothetical protein PPL_06906 [Heterostelium album PN500]|uniref:RRM domain-containing protein n=1 Tax=Heterostelium pallidum (strain ATCC 26659 / Pp 5 / PN500) TaxID=670386 RepID=D3BDV3_HETP5|nr:hypothetical protein PPL_06906 [Heterostelium album PN500]EFA80084.1 hypothetical protein PPL_06906 [Heterostelium album PN500]|eukprot:XP_020432204.1 hypothetical protein PPL_06906 [Heterostelium album PN500]
MTSTIFIGNLPFDTLEEEIVEILSEAGNVVWFRTVFDKMTGRSKGYGFCEYNNHDQALIAANTLNNRIYKARAIRISLSDRHLQG